MPAARKHATLVVASFAFLAAFALAGSAGGVPGTKDREALSAPTNVRVTAATPSSVSLAWDPSHDGSLVAGYWVYVDEVRAEISGSEYTGKAVPVEVSGTKYTAFDFDCGQSIGIWIVAFDRKTNRSPAARATVSTAACPDTQAPTAPTGFHQAATSESAVMLEWKASSDDVGVVGYGVYRNQLPVQSPPQPAATLSGLVCGSWGEFQIDAVDAAGNRSPRRSAWVQTAPCPELPSPPKPTVPVPPAPPTLPAPPSPPTLPGPPSVPTVPPPTRPAPPSPPSIDALAVDSTPPSQPASLAISAATRTSVTLDWSLSSDNFSVAGYDVYRNGTKMASVASTSFTLGALTCGTPFWSGVEAFDAAGNRSPRVRVNPTTSACPLPPANLAFSGATTSSVSLSWSPSTDTLGIAGYDVYRNGTKMTSVTSTSSTQGGLACGTSYWFGVEALDTAGNRSQRVRVNSKTPDCPRQPSPPTLPPPPAPDSPADDTPPTEPANLAVSAATRTSVSLTWSPSTDNVEVSGYRVYVNGAPAANPTLPAALVSGLTCGTAFPFEVDAVDTAGNRSPRARITASTAACADTQAPTAPTNVSASSRSATSIALTWSASSDNVGVSGYGLYRGGSSVGSASTTTAIFSGLTCNTNYTLAVDALDAAGNRSQMATVMVSTTACPDSTSPTAPTGLAASSVTQSSLLLTWNASTDSVGVAGYDVYRNGTEMASVTSTSSSQGGLACNTSYFFGVEAFDAAGNRSARVSVNPKTSACPPPPAPPPSGETLVFADEFDAQLNTGTWSTCHFWAPGPLCENDSTGEIMVYNPDDVFVENGNLVLRAQKRQIADQSGKMHSYSSGMVQSGGNQYGEAPGFDFQYGRAEARVKMPKGRGLWPGWWMAPQNYEWPPEIDIVEFDGKSPNNSYHTYHWDGGGQNSHTHTGPDFTAGFHTFGIDWSPGLLIWTVDGVEVYRFTNAVVASEPMYLYLNLAVGGIVGLPDATTAFPAYYLVDYVRVWKRA